MLNYFCDIAKLTVFPPATISRLDFPCRAYIASLEPRLHIPAGTAVRFEPGERKRVRLVALAGERLVYGGNGLIDGQLDDAGKKQQALEKLS